MPNSWLVKPCFGVCLGESFLEEDAITTVCTCQSTEGPSRTKTGGGRTHSLFLSWDIHLLLSDVRVSSSLAFELEPTLLVLQLADSTL